MTIKELQELYEKGWLGVEFAIPSSIEVTDRNGETVILEPNQAYEITHLSVEYMAAIFKVDEEKSVFFKLDAPIVRFLNIHSDILN